MSNNKKVNFKFITFDKLIRGYILANLHINLDTNLHINPHVNILFLTIESSSLTKLTSPTARNFKLGYPLGWLVVRSRTAGTTE